MMSLTEEEEFRIGMDAWTEYRKRANQARLFVFAVCLMMLACVFVVCVVSVVPVFNCRSGDCSVVDGLFVGALVSGLLLVVVSAVCCAECAYREELPIDTADRRAVMLLILEKREKLLRAKESDALL